MKVATPALLLVLGSVLLTWSLTASIIAPPARLDSRDVLVIGEGLAGLAFAWLAIRRFRGINRSLKG